MKVSVRVISKLEEMKGVENGWDKVIREESKSPFLFSGFANQFFMQNELSDFKLCGMDGFVPTFLTISVDNEIVGVCPVGIVDVLVRFCKFIPTDFQPDVVCENNYRELCLKHTVDFLFRKMRCHFVDFSLQANSPNLDLLKGVCRQLGIQFSMTAEAGHSILQVRSDWADFEKSLGRNYGKLIRRIERHLSAAGPWQIS